MYIYILAKASLVYILETDPRVIEGVYEIRFADDAKLRFNACPAATHRLAVCREAE
jgi:hypothetical protein